MMANEGSTGIEANARMKSTGGRGTEMDDEEILVVEIMIAR